MSVSVRGVAWQFNDIRQLLPPLPLYTHCSLPDFSALFPQDTAISLSREDQEAINLNAGRTPVPVGIIMAAAEEADTFVTFPPIILGATSYETEMYPAGHLEAAVPEEENLEKYVKMVIIAVDTEHSWLNNENARAMLDTME